MRFRVERSGGFAGLVLRAEADAADLPDDVVAGAVDCDWSSVPAPPGRRDGFVYRLELLPPDDGPVRAVELSEPPPSTLRPLVDALMARAEVAEQLPPLSGP